MRVSFQIWAISGHYFSKYFFRHTLFLILMNSSGNRNVKNFLVTAHRLLKFCPFFNTPFSLLFKLKNLYCSSFKFTDSFLCLLHSAVQPIHWGFCFGYFSVPQFFFVFFFCIFGETFYFSFVIGVSLSASWSIFIMVALNSLSDNSNNCVILVSASLECLFSFKFRFSLLLAWQMTFS